MTFPRVQLGDIADYINGVAFKPADWEESGRRIIRIQNLTDSGKPYNRTNREVAEKYHVLPGDLLVSWSATLGVFTWTGPDTALVNQHIFRVVPDSDRIDSNYLRHMLVDALNYMERHLHGATMKHVNRREFLATTIPLPPLPEQKRIAAILEAADALRAKRRESIALLDDLLQSTFLDMFGDPVKNPKTWPVFSIAELIQEMRSGASLKPEDFTTSGFPVLHKGAIKPNGVVELDLGKKTFASDEYAQSKPKSLISKEFVAVTLRDLVPTGPSIGLAANLERNERDEYLLAQGTYGFRLNRDYINPDYFVALSNDVGFRTVLRRFAVGSTQIHIRSPIYQGIKIPVPPIGLQRDYARIFESIEGQRIRLHTHLSELNRLFHSLQSHAFGGSL